MLMIFLFFITECILYLAGSSGIVPYQNWSTCQVVTSTTQIRGLMRSQWPFQTGPWSGSQVNWLVGKGLAGSPTTHQEYIQANTNHIDLIVSQAGLQNYKVQAGSLVPTSGFTCGQPSPAHFSTTKTLPKALRSLQHHHLVALCILLPSGSPFLSVINPNY